MTAIDDARAGELDALRELADGREAYKWLLVAEDFGHEEAGEHLADLEENHPEFRHDDDGHHAMLIHFHLAISYLKGDDGLPRDSRLATKHFEAFLDGPHGDLDSVRADFIGDLEAQLSADERAVVERCLAAQPFRAVRVRSERMQHLHDLNRDGASIPVVILEGEAERLREETEAAIVALMASR